METIYLDDWKEKNLKHKSKSRSTVKPGQVDFFSVLEQRSLSNEVINLDGKSKLIEINEENKRQKTIEKLYKKYEIDELLNKFPEVSNCFGTTVIQNDHNLLIYEDDFNTGIIDEFLLLFDQGEIGEVYIENDCFNDYRPEVQIVKHICKIENIKFNDGLFRSPFSLEFISLGKINYLDAIEAYTYKKIFKLRPNYLFILSDDRLLNAFIKSASEIFLTDENIIRGVIYKLLSEIVEYENDLSNNIIDEGIEIELDNPKLLRIDYLENIIKKLYALASCFDNKFIKLKSYKKKPLYLIDSEHYDFLFGDESKYLSDNKQEIETIINALLPHGVRYNHEILKMTKDDILQILFDLPEIFEKIDYFDKSAKAKKPAPEDVRFKNIFEKRFNVNFPKYLSAYYYGLLIEKNYKLFAKWMMYYYEIGNFGDLNIMENTIISMYDGYCGIANLKEAFLLVCLSGLTNHAQADEMISYILEYSYEIGDELEKDILMLLSIYDELGYQQSLELVINLSKIFRQFFLDGDLKNDFIKNEIKKLNIENAKNLLDEVDKIYT